MFRERLHKGYAQSLELTGVVAEETSHYQKIKIFDTVANGRVMVLDDIVQITTRDESAYAEMLTHLPLLEHGKAERVMIVGGGDLSIADEALKHKALKEVVLVDIDGRVVELCREHFGSINAKAFKDRRLKIEVADAFEYLGRPAAKRRFDLIVADRPDPVGPGIALFGETFYERVRRALDALPESQRAVVHLHRYEGLTFAQVAAVLGTSEVAVRGRAFRAYGQLRKQLADLFDGGAP